MTSLGDALAGRPASDPLWHGQSGWRTVCDVRSAASAYGERISARRVALAFTQDELLAFAILAAEARCEAALLVPASWDQSMLDRYLPRAGVEMLLTDRPELSAPCAVHLDRHAMGVSGARFARAAGDVRWIIPTSGTTGEPKLVEHTLASLARTVKTDATKGRELIWGLVYELARFAGLQVFLQALLGGSCLVFAQRESNIEMKVAALVDAGCNALSATPTLWRRIMMTEAAARMRLRLATLGGEIADQAILSLLTKLHPQAKVLHIYASTEAGVGFSVTDGRAGFPAYYLEQSPASVGLKVDAEGMLWLRPAVAMQRFVGGDSLVDADGWINSGDQVRRDGDRLYFLGRANGTINVGGNKVFPEEVEDCIRSVEGVLQVAVRGRANPITGSLVEAFVQAAPAADRAALKRSITAACRAARAPYKVPALVTWVDELSVNAAGKLMRP